MGQRGRPSKHFTREERAIAAANGIDRTTMNRRYENGWTKKEAMTLPPGFIRERWVHIAQRNGISANAYYSRLRRGLSEEDAATIADLKAGRKKEQCVARDDTPRKIKQAEGTAPPEVVAKQYGKSTEEVQTIWRYYA